MTVEVIGWPELTRAMAGVPAACERAAARAGQDAARALAAQTAPTLPVRTGRLRASVGVITDHDGAATVISAPYAVYVPAARAMAARTESTAADYARRARTETDNELGRLPWPK